MGVFDTIKNIYANRQIKIDAKELPESVMLGAVLHGHKEMQAVIKKTCIGLVRSMLLTCVAVKVTSCTPTT